MVIRILAGGPSFLVPESLPVENDSIWVGVDRGISGLLHRNIEPEYLFGDFDSVSEEDKKDLERRSNVFSFPPEKAKTDLELAIDWAVEQHPEKVEIFGATGGRLDHEWANLQLLAKGLACGVETVMIDRQNWMRASAPGCYEIVKDEAFPYVSFLPLNQSIKGLTLKGFKYPLDDEYVQAGSTLTVSNELIEESGTYSFESGIVLVIRSRDHS